MAKAKAALRKDLSKLHEIKRVGWLNFRIMPPTLPGRNNSAAPASC
ncbi:MAG: hypothetical protein ACOYXT_07680 [Bacteroidota bacterium]